MDRPLRVAVGSKNPAKIKAAEEAFRMIFGNNVEIIPLSVPNTPIQPMSDKEMIEGAIWRAKYSIMKTQAKYGVGMEGGVIRNKYGVFVKGWVAVTDGEVVGIASTVSVQLPEEIWDLLRKGIVRELEEIMVKLTGIENIGDTIGAIGYMAEGKYDRVKAFRDAILCAFGRIRRREIFEEDIMMITSEL